MPWPNALPCTAQLRIPDKGRTIKMFVVCLVVWLRSMKGMGLRTVLIPCCGQDGYRAQVPQHPIET